MTASKKMAAMVASHIKKAAHAKNEQVLHIALTVGQRVLNHVAFVPATVSKFIAMKNGDGSIVATVRNTEDGCYGELDICGVTHYAMPEEFGRIIDYAILRVDDKIIGKVYSAE